MARRTFDVVVICEIFGHWHAGRSENEIAGSPGSSRNTIGKYVAADMVAGGPPVCQERWAHAYQQLIEAIEDHPTPRASA